MSDTLIAASAPSTLDASFLRGLSMTIAGGCLCGTVRYEVDDPIDMLLHCHCSMCRKHHGTAFATFATAPAAGFRWLAGQDEIGTYASSPNGTRLFCRHCGAVAPFLMQASGQVCLPAGNLKGEFGMEPQCHIFVGSKAPWYEITDPLPQHREYPPGYDAPVFESPVRETRTGVTSGSCLCGDVAFEITTPPQRMFYCHCSRCRRARSAAHAANLFYGLDGFTWIRGAERVRGYKIPEAKFFTNAFCERCGSKVPRVSQERGAAVVPAGSLDVDPGMRSMGHIYVADKAPWFRITDHIPQFAQAPS